MMWSSDSAPRYDQLQHKSSIDSCEFIAPSAKGKQIKWTHFWENVMRKSFVGHSMKIPNDYNALWFTI